MRARTGIHHCIIESLKAAQSIIECILEDGGLSRIQGKWVLQKEFLEFYFHTPEMHMDTGEISVILQGDEKMIRIAGAALNPMSFEPTGRLPRN